MTAASDSRTPWVTSPHPWLDVTHAPIYIARLPRVSDDGDLIQYFAALEPFLLKHTRPYVFITDTTFVTSATATQRRIVAESDIRLREHDAKWCAGVAIVAKTALVRGAVTAVYWISPPVYPYRVVATLSEGIVWGHAQLEAVQSQVRP